VAVEWVLAFALSHVIPVKKLIPLSSKQRSRPRVQLRHICTKTKTNSRLVQQHGSCDDEIALLKLT